MALKRGEAEGPHAGEQRRAERTLVRMHGALAAVQETMKRVAHLTRDIFLNSGVAQSPRTTDRPIERRFERISKLLVALGDRYKRRDADLSGTPGRRYPIREVLPYAGVGPPGHTDPRAPVDERDPGYGRRPYVPARQLTALKEIWADLTSPPGREVAGREHLGVAKSTLELQRKASQEQQKSRRVLEELRDAFKEQNRSTPTLGVVGP